MLGVYLFLSGHWLPNLAELAEQFKLGAFGTFWNSLLVLLMLFSRSFTMSYLLPTGCRSLCSWLQFSCRQLVLPLVIWNLAAGRIWELGTACMSEARKAWCCQNTGRGCVLYRCEGIANLAAFQHDMIKQKQVKQKRDNQTCVSGRIETQYLQRCTISDTVDTSLQWAMGQSISIFWPGLRLERQETRMDAWPILAPFFLESLKFDEHLGTHDWQIGIWYLIATLQLINSVTDPGLDSIQTSLVYIVSASKGAAEMPTMGASSTMVHSAMRPALCSLLAIVKPLCAVRMSLSTTECSVGFTASYSLLYSVCLGVLQIFEG